MIVNKLCYERQETTTNKAIMYIKTLFKERKKNLFSEIGTILTTETAMTTSIHFAVYRQLLYFIASYKFQDKCFIFTGFILPFTYVTAKKNVK